jgi:hypothetical protein
MGTLFTRVGSGLDCKHFTWLEKPAIKKHSSLFVLVTQYIQGENSNVIV